MPRLSQLVFLTFFSCAAAFAQILPSRNLIATPLADTGGTYGLLARSHFFAEAARGANSAGDDRAWDATVGGFADLYRWSSGNALRVRFDQELLANSLTSDIHFKPRSMQYEENISGVFRANSFDYELGFTYRCKHDIDNTDIPTSSITPRTDSIPQKRVLILGGIYGAASLDPIDVAPNFFLTLFGRADYYLIHEDNRFPVNNEGELWSNARASMMMNARLSYSCSPDFSLYTSGWVNPLFGAGAGADGSVNARGEIGAHFAGAAGGLEIFLATEHWFDDLSIPVPRASNAVSLGIRVN